MLKTSLFCLIAAAAAAQTSIPIQFHPQGQSAPGELMSGFATLGNGVSMRYVTRLEPPLDGQNWNGGGGTRMDHNGIHRFVTDPVHHQYFGYDLSVQPGPSPKQYTVTIAPLSLTAQDMQDFQQIIKSTFSPVLLPKYPASQVVQDGDTIALDLLVSADGKQKVVDYLQISSTQGSEPQAATNTQEPKDATVDDGPVKFDFRGARVLVNGQRFQGTLAFAGGRSGATFWLAVPGQGRYILSLNPHNEYGMQKSGAIRDNVIQFTAPGGQYEIRLMSPIVGSGGAWNLYMLHDLSYVAPNHHSTDNGDAVLSGGTDRLENLLPKH